MPLKPIKVPLVFTVLWRCLVAALPCYYAFSSPADDEMWEAMIGGTWPKEFCCKVAKLEDRRCHLCHNHVAAAVRSAVSEGRQAVENAERKHESGERGPTGHPAWVATCEQEESADPKVDEETHKEAAELVE